MSRNYKFYNPKGVYFVSFTVADWIAIFTRNEHKDIVVERFRFLPKGRKESIGYNYNLIALTSKPRITNPR